MITWTFRVLNLDITHGHEHDTHPPAHSSLQGTQLAWFTPLSHSLATGLVWPAGSLLVSALTVTATSGFILCLELPPHRLYLSVRWALSLNSPFVLTNNRPVLQCVARTASWRRNCLILAPFQLAHIPSCSYIYFYPNRNPNPTQWLHRPSSIQTTLRISWRCVVFNPPSILLRECPINIADALFYSISHRLRNSKSCPSSTLLSCSRIV